MWKIGFRDLFLASSNNITLRWLQEFTSPTQTFVMRVWSLLVVGAAGRCGAFSVPTRRAVLALPLVVAAPAAQAFDGSGASSYSGRTQLSAATKAKGYRDRIAADVKDFNALGGAIAAGETSGPAWVDFFIQYQRREPDAVGRTYAAQIDLLGADRSGGAALLLVNTAYLKPNKPPDNLPQFKKYTAFAKTIEALQAAGKAGDAAKAQKVFTKSAEALSAYLESVDMPADLSDVLYK